jgi:hypothetical protein
MARGLSNSATASELVITERAVNKYVNRIFSQARPAARPTVRTGGCSRWLRYLDGTIGSWCPERKSCAIPGYEPIR